jgi:hypothetical protein
VGLLALTIAGFTFWACYDTVVHPPETDTSRTTLWGIVYVLAFVAVALTVFAARLIVPVLRVEGGRIIGQKGLVAFLVMYALVLVGGVIAGSAPPIWIIPPLLILGAAGFLLWKRLKSRPVP